MDAYDKGVDKYCSNCGQALDWSDEKLKDLLTNTE